MASLNPIQLLMLLKSGNPRQVAESIIQNNFPNDPKMQNLLQMGMKGDTQGLQQFAQQYLSQQGEDFNSEMNNLMRLVNGQ